MPFVTNCERCNAPVLEGEKLCHECGERLFHSRAVAQMDQSTIRCPRCGRQMRYNGLWEVWYCPTCPMP